MENMSNLKAIGEKIEKLSIAIGALAKDGHNDFSHYDFISNEQMITALRGSCLEYGLSIIPSVIDYEERDIASGQKTAVRSIVRMSFRIVDLDTGYEIIEHFIGAEQDTGGKSMQQAITQCTKYFFFKLLKVTSSDEIDSDSVTTQTEAKKAPTKEDNREWLNEGTEAFSKCYLAIHTDGYSLKDIQKKYKVSKKVQELLMKKEG